MHAPRIIGDLHRLWRETRESISMLVVTACIGLFLVLAALNLFHIMSWQQALSVLGLSYVGVVRRFWLFQFLTAPLLHGNLTHLAFNMLTLWMLGPSVEVALGRRRYVVFSVLSAFCSMAGFLLWNLDRGTIGLGYSGVIFGILVAQAIFFPNKVIYIYAFFPLKMKHAVLILSAVELYLLVSPSRNGIAHSAHLFGAVGAWVYLQSSRRWAAQCGARILPARDWTPLGLVRAAAQHRPPQAGQKKGSSAIVHRDRHVKTCVQCGADLPPGGGPSCARCVAQQATLPGVRPSQRSNVVPAMKQAPSLVILTGSLSGQRFVLSNQRLSIGRSPDNPVAIPDDKKVSRLHAEVVPDGHGRYAIIDKNSSNGLFVNGKQIARHILQPNDRIRIGATELIFADYREVQ